MKTWETIECSGDFSYGISEDGDNFIQTEVIGWNNGDYETDVEELATVRALILDSYGGLEVEVLAEYKQDDARNNLSVRRLVKELEDLIIKEVMRHINE